MSPVRKTLAALAVSTLLLTAALPAQALGRGDMAPTFTLPTAQGIPMSLADYRGQLIYVDFWASWCGPCRDSFPWLNRLQARYGAQGFKVIAVNVDSDKAAAAQFLKRYPANFSVVYDPKGQLASQYALPGMPVSFLIGPDGRVLGRHVGFREGDGEKLNAAIADLLKQK